MKLFTIIAILFTLNSGFAQTQRVIVEKTGQNMFVNMKYSVQHDQLFATTKTGEIFVIDAGKESIVNHARLSTKSGIVYLDNTGTLGAFVDQNQMVKFFSQRTLKVVDSLRMPKISDSEMNYAVWFTDQKLLVGNNKNNYSYDLNKRLLAKEIQLTDYRILDYNHEMDVLLLGYWDETIPGDGNKIKTLFTAKATKLYDKAPRYSSETVINSSTGAYLMEYGTKVVVLDKSGISINHYDNHSGISEPTGNIRAIAKMDDKNLFYSVLSNQVYTLKSYDTSFKEHKMSMKLKYASYTNNIFKTNSNKLYILNSYDGTKTRIIVIR